MDAYNAFHAFEEKTGKFVESIEFIIKTINLLNEQTMPTDFRYIFRFRYCST